MQPPPKRNRCLIPSLVLLLVATLSPSDGKIAGEYLDKVVHFSIFFFLSWNLIYKWEDRFFPYLFGAVLLGVFTEFAQQYIPGRNRELVDVLADTLGVIVAYACYRFFPTKMDHWLKRMGA